MGCVVRVPPAQLPKKRVQGYPRPPPGPPQNPPKIPNPFESLEIPTRIPKLSQSPLSDPQNRPGRPPNTAPRTHRPQPQLALSPYGSFTFVSALCRNHSVRETHSGGELMRSYSCLSLFYFILIASTESGGNFNVPPFQWLFSLSITNHCFPIG